MALYITYDRSFKRDTEKEAIWHVGEELPNIAANRVIELQVDGDEKEHIENLMGQLVDKPVARYYGDIARTIWINL